MRVSEQTRNQIMAMLQRMAEAIGRKDIEGIMALTDPDFRGFGIGVDERVIGKEAYRRHIEREFAKTEAISLELRDSYRSRGDNRLDHGRYDLSLRRRRRSADLNRADDGGAPRDRPRMGLCPDALLPPGRRAVISAGIVSGLL